MNSHLTKFSEISSIFKEITDHSLLKMRLSPLTECLMHVTGMFFDRTNEMGQKVSGGFDCYFCWIIKS